MQPFILTGLDLTFMQQSEGWIKWSFSLSEEKQFSIHRQDFNVFMARKTKFKLKTQRQTLTQYKTILNTDYQNDITISLF